MASAAGALALGVAGSAFACTAADFTGTAQCQQSSGNALLTISDSDSSRTSATVEIDYNGQKVGSVDFYRNQQDTDTQTVVVPWETSGHWSLKAQASGRDLSRQRESTIPVPGGDCSTPSTPPTTAPPTTAPPTTAPPTTAPPTTAPPTTTPPTSAAPSSSAPVVVPTTPSASASSSVKASTSASASASTSVEATASPSPSGTSLASTGGGSDAGLFAGIGAVLIAAGGATVFFLRRRAAGNHA
nr:LAETG motif-containing sortase-dependent surface protein [Streptomyces sp. 846.5]